MKFLFTVVLLSVYCIMFVIIDTVLPAKSDIDVMFCFKAIRDL